MLYRSPTTTHCRRSRLNSYLSRLGIDLVRICPPCEGAPHDTNRHFSWSLKPPHLTTLSLWAQPIFWASVQMQFPIRSCTPTSTFEATQQILAIRLANWRKEPTFFRYSSLVLCAYMSLTLRWDTFFKSYLEAQVISYSRVMLNARPNSKKSHQNRVPNGAVNHADFFNNRISISTEFVSKQ